MWGLKKERKRKAILLLRNCFCMRLIVWRENDIFVFILKKNFPCWFPCQSVWLCMAKPEPDRNFFSLRDSLFFHDRVYICRMFLYFFLCFKKASVFPCNLTTFWPFYCFVLKESFGGANANQSIFRLSMRKSNFKANFENS